MQSPSCGDPADERLVAPECKSSSPSAAPDRAKQWSPSSGNPSSPDASPSNSFIAPLKTFPDSQRRNSAKLQMGLRACNGNLQGQSATAVLSLAEEGLEDAIAETYCNGVASHVGIVAEPISPLEQYVTRSSAAGQDKWSPASTDSSRSEYQQRVDAYHSAEVRAP